MLHSFLSLHATHLLKLGYLTAFAYPFMVQLFGFPLLSN